MRPSRPFLAPRRGRIRAALGAVVAGCASAGIVGALLWTPQVWAQEVPGGLRLTLGVSQRFEVDTNRGLDAPSEGTSTLATTRLRFGLVSETRNQRLSFGSTLDARLVNGPSDDRSTTTGDPNLNFSYSRSAARSDLRVSGSYLSEDIRFIRPIDQIVDVLEPEVPVPPVEPVDPDDPDAPPADDPADPPPLDDLPEDDDLDDLDDLTGEGTRHRLNLNSTLRLGLGGPLVTSLRAGVRSTTYSGDANPNLTDTRRITLGSSVSMRLTPVTQGTLALSFERFERDNLADLRRDTLRLSYGITHQLTQALSVNARIGRSRVETREFNITRQRDGADGGLGFTLQLPRSTLSGSTSVRTTDTDRVITASLSQSIPMPNGSLGWSVTARDAVEGTRVSATVNRSMDLPRGSLSGNLGVTRGPSGELGPIGRVSYREDLASGTFRASLQQGFTLDSDDEESSRTLLNTTYTHQINEGARLSLNAAYSRIDGDDNGRFSATYSQDVTRDWGMSLGYRYDTRDRTAGRAEGHRVFLTLDRSFNIGF
jgi:hypothetical protein